MTHCYILLMTGCMCYLTGSMYVVCVTLLDQCMLYVLPHWINVCCMCYLAGSMYVVCVTSLDQCMLYVLPHWINVCCMCYLTGSMYVVWVTSLDQCMLYVTSLDHCMLYVLPHWINVCCMNNLHSVTHINIINIIYRLKTSMHFSPFDNYKENTCYCFCISHISV